MLSNTHTLGKQATGLHPELRHHAQGRATSACGRLGFDPHKASANFPMMLGLAPGGPSQAPRILKCRNLGPFGFILAYPHSLEASQRRHWPGSTALLRAARGRGNGQGQAAPLAGSQGQLWQAAPSRDTAWPLAVSVPSGNWEAQAHLPLPSAYTERASHGACTVR